MNQTLKSTRTSFRPHGPKRTALVVSALVALLAGPAAAEGCGPRCDYWHYYGPYDFTYISPGLFAYPRCNQQGNCSPYLTYVYSGRRYGRVTVRPANHARLPPTETGR
jgi:hypothetical protein